MKSDNREEERCENCGRTAGEHVLHPYDGRRWLIKAYFGSHAYDIYCPKTGLESSQ